MFNRLMIEEINNIEAVKLVLENGSVTEMFVDQNDRNLEVNDFINDVRNDIFELQKLSQNIENMNTQQEQIMQLVQKIGDRADVAFEKLKVSPPEDVNEAAGDRDLIGASVLGIGGEEKLVDVSKSREANDDHMFFFDNNEEEIRKIKEIRKGDSTAPLFFQMGGWYYDFVPLKGKTDVMKVIFRVNKSPRMTKRQALDKMQSYIANSKSTPQQIHYP
jgi:hypothetical protein